MVRMLVSRGAGFPRSKLCDGLLEEEFKDALTRFCRTQDETPA